METVRHNTPPPGRCGEAEGFSLLCFSPSSLKPMGYQWLTKKMKEECRKGKKENFVLYTGGKSVFSYIQSDLYSFLEFPKELSTTLTEN